MSLSTITTEDFNPTEANVLTLNFSSELSTGETLTGTPAATCVMFNGTDPNAASFIGAPQINVAQLTKGADTMAAGQAVQVPIAGGLAGCSYLITVTCKTTNAAKSLAREAIVPVATAKKA